MVYKTLVDPFLRKLRYKVKFAIFFFKAQKKPLAFKRSTLPFIYQAPFQKVVFRRCAEAYQ